MLIVVKIFSGYTIYDHQFMVYFQTTFLLNYYFEKKSLVKRLNNDELDNKLIDRLYISLFIHFFLLTHSYVYVITYL